MQWLDSRFEAILETSQLYRIGPPLNLLTSHAFKKRCSAFYRRVITDQADPRREGRGREAAQFERAANKGHLTRARGDEQARNSAMRDIV